MGKRTNIGLASLAASVLVCRFFSTGLNPVTIFFAVAVPAYFGLFIYSVFLYPYLLSPIRHLPGPSPDSYLNGNLSQIFKYMTGLPQCEWIKIPNNGLIRYTVLWNTERIMPTNAKVLQQVFPNDGRVWLKPPADSGLTSFLGLKGLLFLDGDEHRHQRRIMMPAFSFGHIKNLVPTFWDKSMYLADQVAAEASTAEKSDVRKGGQVDFARWSSLATLDIIGAAGLGYDFRAMETGGEGSKLARAYQTIFADRSSSTWTKMLRMVLPSWIFSNLPLERVRQFKEATRSLKEVSHELIASKRQEIAEQKAGDEKDILSVLLKSGEYDTPEGNEIARDHLMTVLAAGHETTASLLQWALFQLTRDPQDQKLLRDEIRGTFPHGLPESISYEQLEGLRHLRNFFTETTRFYPPVSVSIRKAGEDTILAGEFIPKGTALVFAPLALNRNPQVWGEDSDEFKPSRWEGGNAMESNYNLLTFLAGPRSCIGKDFAKLEFKALLVALIARFEFEATADHSKMDSGSGITLKPKGGLKLWVREVEGW
jgi:cytochrome P450